MNITKNEPKGSFFVILKSYNIPAQRFKITLFAGEEYDLMALGALADERRGAFCALVVHVGEGVVKDDNPAAVGE